MVREDEMEKEAPRRVQRRPPRHGAKHLPRRDGLEEDGDAAVELDKVLTMLVWSEHLVAIQEALIVQVVVFHPGISRPKPQVFGNKGQRYAYFHTGGEDRQPGAAWGAIHLLVELVAHQVDGGRELEGEVLQLERGLDPDGEVEGTIRGAGVKDDRGFLIQLLPEGDPGIQANLPRYLESSKDSLASKWVEVG